MVEWRLRMNEVNEGRKRYGRIKKRGKANDIAFIASLPHWLSFEVIAIGWLVIRRMYIQAYTVIAGTGKEI